MSLQIKSTKARYQHGQEPLISLTDPEESVGCAVLRVSRKKRNQYILTLLFDRDQAKKEIRDALSKIARGLAGDGSLTRFPTEFALLVEEHPSGIFRCHHPIPSPTPWPGRRTQLEAVFGVELDCRWPLISPIIP